MPLKITPEPAKARRARTLEMLLKNAHSKCCSKMLIPNAPQNAHSKLGKKKLFEKKNCLFCFFSPN